MVGKGAGRDASKGGSACRRCLGVLSNHHGHTEEIGAQLNQWRGDRLAAREWSRCCAGCWAREPHLADLQPSLDGRCKQVRNGEGAPLNRCAHQMCRGVSIGSPIERIISVARAAPTKIGDRFRHESISTER